MVFLIAGVTACGSTTPTAAASSTTSRSHHHPAHHAQRRRLHGKITALTATTLTITTKKGIARTVHSTSTTRVRSGHTRDSTTALKLGEVVTVLERRGSAVLRAAAIRIRPGT